MPEGNSFLPRIESVFYAVFDARQGTKIVYQVPEGLIAVSSPTGPSSSSTNGSNSVPHTPVTDTLPPLALPPPMSQSANGIASRESNSSLVSLTESVRPSNGRRSLVSSPQQKRSTSSQTTLFNFSDISMYIIPPPALCGRLVTCSTRQYSIIGFPVEINGRYMRNYFLYNFCFVFKREADLSCYEPIVRKVSEILKSCEVCCILLVMYTVVLIFFRKNQNFYRRQQLPLLSMPSLNNFTKI